MQQPQRPAPSVGILAMAASFASAGDGRQLSSVFGFFTMFLDMILRPWFGSAYYSRVQIFANTATSWLAITVCGAASGALEVFYFKGSGKWALYSTAFLHLAFLAGLVYHGYRLAMLYIHIEREADDETDGPPLPIFRHLRHGKEWGWVRMLWEPLFISIAFTILAIIGIVPVFFPLYVYVCSFALFMRALATWDDGRSYSRFMMNQVSRMKIIEGIANGVEPPETMGRSVLAGIPASTPPHQRKLIAMNMAGLTPEMEAMLSKPERASPMSLAPELEGLLSPRPAA